MKWKRENHFGQTFVSRICKHNRCIVYVDGFYEHHNYKGNTYHFFVFRKDKEPLA
ncbi:SOS response-associated peptidase family protein [Gillisia lutea]|uniref:SOS response-associated peptidase family protein n=1 Tax=Gillisia lutea TaxID=2909668 RepID=UPI0027E5AEFC|nr:SOS response-associated peptidase family protein [Gillisia lutea]